MGAHNNEIGFLTFDVTKKCEIHSAEQNVFFNFCIGSIILCDK